ncbi:aspartate/glutamate racemase family protein [Streptomyces phaeofaciens JCM 4814]|uniref:Decarboxylase n=1 Tax=Streptomyces phaeofaciens TaxID=68254 RepID=A0A918H759_9ACTN|nr:decarboxylase [Streptomyces phaeofaciens]GGT41976.1 decarboxylase [Streptomyces phaeofaciens]
MTTLGFLYPGHSAEDDYPRIEQLLGSDIRLDLVHTDVGEDAPEGLAKGVEQLRLAGAEAVVWVCAREGFALGGEGVRQQVRGLAMTAGTPASATPFAFLHAAREIGAARVAVGVAGPDEAAGRLVEFLRAGGLEVVGSTGAGEHPDAAAAGNAGEAEVLALARAADDPRAEAVLLPDPDLHTAAHLPALEEALGKPVLTAAQVAVWEALRLTGRRVNAPGLGALFAQEPIVQM